MATLEAMAFQARDVLDVMKQNASCQLKSLRVDGGASVSDVLLQFQSDILGVNVSRPKITETTALGCAMLAGLKSGIWQDKKEIGQSWTAEKTFSPVKDKSSSEQLYKKWKEAVARTLNWID